MAATGPRHVELSITWQWVSPALASVGAKDVAVLRDGVETRVPIGQLRVGERFLVRPGERIATDGLVVEGNSAVDRSTVTGESVPVEVGVGDSVAGGTVDAGGRLIIEALNVGAGTQLARMARLVEQAQARFRLRFHGWHRCQRCRRRPARCRRASRKRFPSAGID